MPEKRRLEIHARFRVNSNGPDGKQSYINIPDAYLSFILENKMQICE